MGIGDHRGPCGKFTHLTEDGARRQMAHDRGKDNKKRANRIQVYWCALCGGFHVGHDGLSGRALKYRRQREKLRNQA